MRGVAGVGKIV
jgi:hypothetical protein